jgi:hypothetical protein
VDASGYAQGALDAHLAISDRYVDIFESRPGLSLALAPFLELVGPAALPLFAIAGSTLAAVRVAWLCGPLVGRAMSNTAVTVLTASASFWFVALPSGMWASRLLYEGAAYTLATLVITLTFISTTSSHTYSSVASAAVGPIACVGMSVKSSVMIPTALILVAALIVTFVARKLNIQVRKRVGTACAGLVTALAIWQFIVAWRGWPGLSETLQDKFTRHFKRADVDKPIKRWWELLGESTVEVLQGLRYYPALVVLVVLARGYLAQRVGLSSIYAFVYLGIAAANFAIHPSLSEVSRLTAPIWIPTAIALAVITVDLGRILYQAFGRTRLQPTVTPWRPDSNSGPAQSRFKCLRGPCPTGPLVALAP